VIELANRSKVDIERLDRVLLSDGFQLVGVDRHGAPAQFLVLCHALGRQDALLRHLVADEAPDQILR
jgi:hypothetical protein